MQNASRKYKNYLLSVLLVTLAFNFFDRTALGLVLEDIKVDLSLSDTQLGFLTGIAFALFYAVLGIPIARYADRGNRVSIIGFTTALWSVAVALCAIAANFWQLLLVRAVAGVGEAGCVPPAQSLIADFFPRTERPRAVSIFMQGIPVSLVLGYFIAGWLNELYGWRLMFVIIGLPGVALAALARFSLREPRRERPRSRESLGNDPSAWEASKMLWRIPTFRHLLYSYSAMFFFSYGGLQWTPAFFVRSFGLRTGELGTWLTVVYGIGGAVGTYCVGEWATRRAANNERLQLKVLAGALSVSVILNAFVYLPAFAPNKYWAFVWLGLTTAAGVGLNGPAFAIIQTLVEDRMRALAIALLYLFANFIGLGCGPWAAGALSDALRPLAGEESLRYAMLALSPGYFWVAWHLWRASGTVTRDLASRRGAAEDEEVISEPPARNIVPRRGEEVSIVDRV